MDTRKITVISVAVIAAALTVAVGVVIGPNRIATASETTGDRELSTVLRDNAPKGSHRIAAFTLQDGEATFSGLGADEHTEFEIGSITKTFTAELLSNAVERGDLSRDTTVGEVIDIPGADAEDITMEELATHTSGLPRLSNMGVQAFLASVTGGNPYEGNTSDKLFDDTRTATLNNRGQFAYSNFGVALLGQLVARASGTTYAELLQKEILIPLGMSETYLMAPGSVPDDAPRGLTSRGREATAWEMDADAPAGAIRSTAHDMAIYTDHILTQPEVNSTWIEEAEGTYFHNGGTGGYSSMLVLDHSAGTAAFAITDTTSSVDDLGRILLDHARNRSQQ